ncbi:28S ribosomal protein S28 [Cricetulus griseus]|nr:28S ribosomal protein S28 [Cricetulus griseus]
MAALCGSHAGAPGSRFLRALLFFKPFRNASTESGSESTTPDSSAPRERSAGFASALERLSELRRKAELGRKEIPESNLLCSALSLTMINNNLQPTPPPYK